MASTNIQRVHASAPTDNKKCTISVWVKRGVLNGSNSSSGIYGGINAAWNAAGNVQIGFMNDKAYCWFKTASGDRKKQESTRVFRDTNAWYHFVYRIDTTQSTASDRIRVYCNNEELTSWGSTADPTLNEDISFTTNGYTNYIGKFNWTSGGVNYFDGSMSHFHFCDGYSYAPTEFGSTDSTTGEWKINTSPSVNYGNNGYFILKDGNGLTDQSPNTNNWSTHNGTLTNTEDNPSNVFATLNPSYKSSGTVTFSNGNTKVVGVDFSNQRTGGTLGASSGKFYFETKMTGSVSFGGSTIGIADYDNVNIANSTTWFGSDSNYLGFYGGGTLKVLNNGSNNDYGTLNVNDIVGFAFDIDNGFAYISRNGTWLNSGDPTSGSTGTGNVNRSGNLNYNFAGKLMGIAGGFQSTDSPISNFGNGYFGTTAVSSAGTNASGNGIFEYDVPTGYTALSTKGLNE